MQSLAGFLSVRAVLERHKAEALRDDSDSINKTEPSVWDAVFQNTVPEIRQQETTDEKQLAPRQRDGLILKPERGETCNLSSIINVHTLGSMY